ncbi:flavin reductase family protein [Herbiconiux sp.]|uniref:flavin reductase family protein n=1 Tax=Herbiconiux sp. TaxID=1871186 RepID=UPI0025BF0B3C|nr:flavin reductase family protein [Herbiconiux sp.]
MSITSDDTVSRDLVDQIAFRNAMGAVATPVSVVTTHLDGPHGTTVSAFMSLSLEPPMVLVSLQESSNLLPPLRATGRFGLNVLAHDQSPIGAGFAKREGDRFAGVAWSDFDGVPRIHGAAAFTVCTVGEMIVAGDHIIVTGLVTHAENHHEPGLVYQHRAFGTFAPH